MGDVFRENRKLQAGDTVWPGYVVARIPDLDEMYVEAQLSDVDDGRVQPGARAEVRLDSYPEMAFAGEVLDLTPVAQEMSNRSLRRAFRVRVALDSTDRERMRPGMAARVEVLSPVVEDVLLVPRAALDFTESAPAAWKENGERVEVAVGACAGGSCVVESGLDEGDQLQMRPRS